MTEYSRLYKRAIAESPYDALWDMTAGRTFFTGPLYYNAEHQHGAPVFLAGIYGSFRLRFPGSDWQTCRTAVIPAGVVHELDLAGEPLAVFYIEPHIAGPEAFKPLIRNTREMCGSLVGSDGEIVFMRNLYEDRHNPAWRGEALDDLLGYATRRALCAEIDPRIAHVVTHLYQHGDDLRSIDALAREVDLSPSRLQHLFTQALGVPYRRYRSWNRIRVGIREILKGHNFTVAAHAAGFSDSAHFTHEFKKTFGAAPSIGLKRLARLLPE